MTPPECPSSDEGGEAQQSVEVTGSSSSVVWPLRAKPEVKLEEEKGGKAGGKERSSATSRCAEAARSFLRDRVAGVAKPFSSAQVLGQAWKATKASSYGKFSRDLRSFDTSSIVAGQASKGSG